MCVCVGGWVNGLVIDNLSSRIITIQNELSILEFIHNIVETFDHYFDSVVSMP